MAGARKNLRPQDILVAAKIALLEGDTAWAQKDVAAALKLSQAEIAFSLDRLVLHGLLNEDKKSVRRAAFFELLIHGLKYFFPVEISGNARGLPTALSYGTMKKSFRISESEKIVWADAEGTERGLSLSPLYETVPFAVKSDPKLYELMSLIDVIRLGGARETQAAKSALEKILLVKK